MMDLEGQKFVRGIELTNGRFVVNSQDPNLDIDTQPHTGFCYWSRDEGWVEIGLAGKLTADATTNEDGTMMLMMDPTGFMHEADGDSVNKEFIKDPQGNIPVPTFRSIRRVGDKVIAVGVDRQAYMREGGKWVMISTADIMTADDPIAFQGVDGFSPSEVYTAGWDGEIWTYNGTAWRQLQSPTNIILNDICAGPDTCVAVGLVGQVISGRGDDWAMVAHDETDDDFWSVRAFNGAFYMSALTGIYKLEDGELTLFREIDEGMRTAYALSVGPSGLWSVGAQDIALFDGTDWHTIGQS
jgi:hypothetical protein